VKERISDDWRFGIAEKERSIGNWSGRADCRGFGPYTSWHPVWMEDSALDCGGAAGAGAGALALAVVGVVVVAVAPLVVAGADPGALVGAVGAVAAEGAVAAAGAVGAGLAGSAKAAADQPMSRQFTRKAVVLRVVIRGASVRGRGSPKIPQAAHFVSANQHFSGIRNACAAASRYLAPPFYRDQRDAAP